MKANSRSFVKVHLRGRYHSFNGNIPPKQGGGSFVVHDRNQRLFIMFEIEIEEIAI